MEENAAFSNNFAEPLMEQKPYRFQSEMAILKDALNGSIHSKSENESVYAYENSFLRRKDREKNSLVLIYEINAHDGSSSYKEVTLRSLLNEVAQEIESCCNNSDNDDIAHNNNTEGYSNTFDKSYDLYTQDSGQINMTETYPPTAPFNHTYSQQQSQYIDESRSSNSHTGLPHSQSRTNLNHSTSHLHMRNATTTTATTTSSTTTHRMPRHSITIEDISFAALNLRIRDLRRLDFSINPNEELTVQVRKHVILFTVDPIRAIITSQKLRIVVPPGADSLMRFLDEYIKDWIADKNALHNMDSKDDLLGIVSSHLRPSESDTKHIHDSASTSAESKSHSHQKSTTKSHHHHHNDHTSSFLSSHSSNLIFEIYAYEALLSTVKDLITMEHDILFESTKKVMNIFKKDAMVSPVVQEKLRGLKEQITRLSSKLSRYHISLEDVIEDDESMALMNLTYLMKKPSLYKLPLSPQLLSKHDEIEEALESYLTDFSALQSKLEFIKSQLTGAEAQASLRLDIARNKVLIANIVIAICSANVTFGAYISGIFGMNLDNTSYIQTVPGVFATVFVGTFILMIVGSWTLYYYLIYTGVIQEDDEKALEKQLKF